MTDHPPIETAIALLKELRDTTPIIAQRKRIDAFLALGGSPVVGEETNCVKGVYAPSPAKPCEIIDIFAPSLCAACDNPVADCRCEASVNATIHDKFDGDFWKWLDTELICIEIIRGSSKFPNGAPGDYLSGFSEAATSVHQSITKLREMIEVADKPMPVSQGEISVDDRTIIETLLKRVYFRKQGTSSAYFELVPYLRTTKPVSIAGCGADQRVISQIIQIYDMPCAYEDARKIAKAVLDAAGVKYHD